MFAWTWTGDTFCIEKKLMFRLAAKDNINVNSKVAFKRSLTIVCKFRLKAEQMLSHGIGGNWKR